LSDPFGKQTIGAAGSLSLGASLARLRHASGLTGHELGQIARMSQAKVSKLENGVTIPTPRDVERYARAAGADPDAIRDLVEQAKALREGLNDSKVMGRRLAAGQQDVAQYEAQATTLRNFQPGVLSGLLQTAEYARSMFGDVLQEMHGLPDEQVSALVPAAVSARIRRQEALANPAKQFRFVLPETLLLHRVCRPAEMSAQIERIRQVAQQDNVTVGIIPTTAQLDYPPLHGFSLMDDRLVVIDLINTSVTTRAPNDVLYYRRVYDSFERHATTDIDEILNRHVQTYLDLARPPSS